MKKIGSRTNEKEICSTKSIQLEIYAVLSLRLKKCLRRQLARPLRQLIISSIYLQGSQLLLVSGTSRGWKHVKSTNPDKQYLVLMFIFQRKQMLASFWDVSARVYVCVTHFCKSNQFLASLLSRYLYLRKVLLQLENMKMSMKMKFYRLYTNFLSIC